MSDSTIVPDTKDWTWVLREPCPECGFDAQGVDRESLGERIRENAAEWARALADPQAAQRPDPSTWSPLEYGCHVRDVHRIFGVRLASMLDEDDPRFANWDQDVTAIEERYAEQEPATVAAELSEAAGLIAGRYDAVADDATWQRTGIRSDGSEFTVDNLGRYQLHDLVHHVWDVSR
jgi:hypothetical protein